MNLTGTTEAELQESIEELHSATIPRLLAERVKADGGRVAVRYKRGGAYRELNWADYQEKIRSAAAGLRVCGLSPEDRLAIMGDVCLEYLLADLGAMFMGAIPCGVYPTSSPEEVAYVLKLVGARIFVAEDQEHVDRLLDAEVQASERIVDKIIVCDGRTLFLYNDPRIVLFEEVMREGATNERARAEVAEFEKAIRPETNSAIIFTSGTTGLPKAAFRSQSSDIIGFGFSFLEVMPEMRARPHRIVCQLPLAHGMGRAMAVYVPLLASVIPHIGEPNQSLPSILNEVRPTYVMGVPRTWEKLVAHVQVAVDSASPLARRVFGLATEVGRARLRQMWKRDTRFASWWLEAIYWPLWLAAIWPALHKIGMTYTTGTCSGGAPLPPVVHETIEAWGIPLRDMFGMTETGGIGAQAGAFPAPTAALRPMTICRVKIGEDQELLLKSPGNVTGYWNDPDATATLFADDGFVRSGDIAEMNVQGEFRIVDRKKDILITSGGKNIAPATVENAIRCSPYISEVIAFGDQRKYVTALIEIDFENVAHWARQRQIPYSGHSSLAQNEAVVRLIESEIEQLNQRLARVEQVKKFRILPKELVPEDGDTTPTRKVKRSHAYKLFGSLIEEMYAEDQKRQEAVNA